MGDKMTCMPFSQIMDWVLEEKKAGKTVFGTHKKYVAGEEKAEIFGRDLEAPIGPASSSGASHRSASRPPHAACAEYHCSVLYGKPFL